MWLQQFESWPSMPHVVFALLSLVVLLQVALGRRARSSIRRAYNRIPAVGNGTLVLNVGHVLHYFLSVLSMCLVGTLLSGVGDAALAQGAAHIVFTGANLIATLIICQTRMEYVHKVKTLQLLLLVDLIVLTGMEPQWAFAGSASVIFLLGACVVVAIAMLVAMHDTGSHELLVNILTSVVGIMFWIVSMQLPPLLGDQQGYIQSTLVATILAIRLRKTPMHALILLSWCLYCMWSFMLSTVVSKDDIDQPITMLTVPGVAGVYVSISEKQYQDTTKTGDFRSDFSHDDWMCNLLSTRWLRHLLSAATRQRTRQQARQWEHE